MMEELEWDHLYLAWGWIMLSVELVLKVEADVHSLWLVRHRSLLPRVASARPIDCT